MNCTECERLREIIGELIAVIERETTPAVRLYGERELIARAEAARDGKGVDFS